MSSNNSLSTLDPNLTVLTGEQISDRYACDWTFVEHQKPAEVACPTSTEEVATIMRHCHETRKPVVVQGGMTGLAGGATPSAGEVSISLEKLTGIEAIDEQAMTMTVLAGTPLQQVQEAALARGLLFPMDLGARGSATIGGNAATNAGGVQVIRYGMTRALILGIEVVLPDGTIISSLNGMLKNNTGYDIKQLFIGSEGTLGVITRLVLRLFPKPASRCTALVAMPSFASAVELLNNCQRHLAGVLSSFEVMWDCFYDNVAPTVEGFRHPFDERHKAYAIVEICGNDQQHDAALFESFLTVQLENDLLADVVIAQSETQAEQLWSVRHGIGEFASASPVINYDVSIPIADMDEFSTALLKDLEVAWPHITALLFGHIGDSNLHVVIGDYRTDEFDALKDRVHELTGLYRGSVSAEHGIGKLKTGYLHLSRSTQEIALMALLKQTIDPHNILNRNRVVPT